MELTPHDRGVLDVTSEQLRAYMASHRENEYVLFDVRQPEEYEAEHVPGAKLVPLMDFEQRLEEIETTKEKTKVFYCRSGGRSLRAAQFAAEALHLSNVFNLVGGMTGWNGEKLPEFPNVRAFDEKAAVTDVLLQAMNLEKGADCLYETLLDHFRGSEVEKVIGELAKAEKAHGRAVYGALKKVSEGHLDDFDKMYQGLEGDILESGQSFEQAVTVAKSVAQHGTPALLELALDMEFKAYDLYRSLAHNTANVDLRNTFLELAEHEKRHARSLLKALGDSARGAKR